MNNLRNVTGGQSQMMVAIRAIDNRHYWHTDDTTLGMVGCLDAPHLVPTGGTAHPDWEDNFKPRDGIRFFALDSNYMDKEQIEWLDKELSGSGSEWKIAFFHHPLYSSGEKHGPDEEPRKIVEPLFIKHNVTVVFTGHEHFYERLKPQKGIHHFIEGSSAKLRKGNIGKSEQSAKGFDEDSTFMLCEIDGDQLHFQTITRMGKTVDSGVITRRQVNLRSSN